MRSAFASARRRPRIQQPAGRFLRGNDHHLYTAGISERCCGRFFQGAFADNGGESHHLVYCGVARSADIVRHVSKKKRRRDQGTRTIHASRARSLSREDAVVSWPAALHHHLFGATAVAWLHRFRKCWLRFYAGHGRGRFHSRLHFAAWHVPRRNRSFASAGPIDFARDSGSADVFAPHWITARRRHHRSEHGRLFRSFKTVSTPRSEEHTSELQSRLHLVCRLLLEKKKHTQ